MGQQRKRIVIFNPASYLGGAERGLLEMIAALKDRYFIKVIHPSGGEIREKLGEYSIECDLSNFTKISRRGFAFRDIFLSISNINGLFCLLDQLKPDILISNGIKAHIISGLYRIYRGVLFVPFIRDAVLVLDIKNRIIESFVKRQADHIIVTTEYLMKNHGFKHNCSVLPNPVFRESLKTIKKKNNKKKLIIGVASHLAPLKGIEDILLAFRHLRASHKEELGIIIAGGNVYSTNREYYDRYTTRVKNLVKRLKLNRDDIRIKKYDFGEMNNFYDEIDILVNCSRSEGFGRSVAEAINAGIPFVTTETGFWDSKKYDFLKDRVYIPGNVDELIKKIEITLKNKHDYNKLCRSSLESILGFENYHNKVNQIMEKLIK